MNYIFILQYLTPNLIPGTKTILPEKWINDTLSKYKLNDYKVGIIIFHIREREKIVHLGMYVVV